jgi:nitroreductase
VCTPCSFGSEQTALAFPHRQQGRGQGTVAACYNRDWFKTAPMYVIASILHDEEWVRSDGKHHGDIDIAIAVEHLCLAATEQGLATCWVCNFDAALCKQLFGLPANEEPAVVIPLGYADDNPKEKKRKPIEDIIR